MNYRKLFLSLPSGRKDAVCATIIEAGIGVEVGSLIFREFIKKRMLPTHGNERQFLKQFRRLSSQEQKLFYDAMLSGAATAN